MFRPHLHARHAQGERHFRWRGGEVSRIEGLTDGVFALAIALLVISLEVPRTFAELTEAFRQVPVFLVCFAMLFYCWHAHFQFHRRYGLEDNLTVFLNGVLIFLVSLYVYPLKFLFGILWNGALLGRGPYVIDRVGDPVPDPQAAGEFLLALDPRADMPMVMILYGLGFAAVFAVFGLMTLHAWAWRDRLELDGRERCVTLAALRSHGISVGFGLTSAAWVALGGGAAWAGYLYFGIGPLQALSGWRSGRAIARMAPAQELEESP
jgi:Endosomal/lysosomal potassium channel TMEM175